MSFYSELKGGIDNGYPSLDELIDKVDSRYTLVVQVARGRDN